MPVESTPPLRKCAERRIGQGVQPDALVEHPTQALGRFVERLRTGFVRRHPPEFLDASAHRAHSAPTVPGSIIRTPDKDRIALHHEAMCQVGRERLGAHLGRHQARGQEAPASRTRRSAARIDRADARRRGA